MELVGRKFGQLCKITSYNDLSNEKKEEDIVK